MLSQEAAGTKGPLRVQRGVAAAPCLIPAYLLSAGFIVSPGFSFYCFSQHRSGKHTQRFTAGSTAPEWWSRGTNRKGPWHIPTAVSQGEKQSIMAPDMSLLGKGHSGLITLQCWGTIHIISPRFHL